VGFYGPIWLQYLGKLQIFEILLKIMFENYTFDPYFLYISVCIKSVLFYGETVGRILVGINSLNHTIIKIAENLETYW